MFKVTREGYTFLENLEHGGYPQGSFVNYIIDKTPTRHCSYRVGMPFGKCENCFQNERELPVMMKQITKMKVLNDLNDSLQLLGSLFAGKNGRIKRDE